MYERLNNNVVVVHESVPHWLYYLIQMEYTKNMYYRTKFFFRPSSAVMCTVQNGLWGDTNSSVIRYTKYDLCADCAMQKKATHRDDNHALLLKVWKKISMN